MWAVLFISQLDTASWVPFYRADAELEPEACSVMNDVDGANK